MLSASLNKTFPSFLPSLYSRQTPWLSGLSVQENEGKEMFYLMAHSTHFFIQLYGIRVQDIELVVFVSEREENVVALPIECMKM